MSRASARWPNNRRPDKSEDRAVRPTRKRDRGDRDWDGNFQVDAQLLLQSLDRTSDFEIGTETARKKKIGRPRRADFEIFFVAARNDASASLISFSQNADIIMYIIQKWIIIGEYPGPPSAGCTFYYAVSGLSGLMVIAVSHIAHLLK